MFVDGSDVFFNGGVREILTKFLAFQKPLVLGTQGTCTGNPSAPICGRFPLRERCGSCALTGLRCSLMARLHKGGPVLWGRR